MQHFCLHQRNKEMQIAATELKSLIKRLAPASSEMTIISDGGLVAAGSDLTICAASDAFKGLGLFQVNARKFSSVVNRLSGQVDVQKMDNVLVVKSAKAKVEIETAAVKPRVFSAPETLHTVPLPSVRDLLKYVSIAADSNKAAFAGGVVQFETVTTGLFDEEKITAIEAMGTDGKRCAWSSVEFDGAAPFKYHITLPAVAAIQGLDGDTIQIGETDSFYYLKSATTTIYANKLAKGYTNYKSILPKSFKFQATVDAAEFKQVLYTVEPMIQDVEQFAVVVHFLDGKLSVRTVGKGGTAQDEMEYVADPLADVSEFQTKINHKILSDYFSVVSGEVTFNANPPVLNKGQMVPQPVILESGNRKIMIAPIAGGS
jgi:DNA polymerase III sliding clamp (beta) subunit (PCNA family)